MARDGQQLISEAVQLVADALRASPRGLTNSEVNERTGLNLPIARHRGYITWTILQHLVEHGKAQKLGKVYRLLQ